MIDIKSCKNLFATFGVLSFGLINQATAQMVQNPALQPNSSVGAWTQRLATASYASPNTADSIEAPAWYRNPSIIAELQLSPAQVHLLDASFGQDWSRYQSSVSALNQTASDAQRFYGQQNLLESFHRNFIQASESAIPNPQIRNRFIQLYLQYRWYNAFNDDVVQQQLNLTSEQDQIFQNLAGEWNDLMALWYNYFPTDASSVREAFHTARNQLFVNVYSNLSQQQFEIWRNLIGDIFDFEPEDYFEY